MKTIKVVLVVTVCLLLMAVAAIGLMLFVYGGLGLVCAVGGFLCGATNLEFVTYLVIGLVAAVVGSWACVWLFGN